MRSILLSAVVLIVIAGIATSTALASSLAFDTASDPAYESYRQSNLIPLGVNGGHGWGSGWQGLQQPSDLGMRVASTAWLPFTDPFSSPGSAWSLDFASGIPSGAPGATRYFDGGLEPGQTFSFDCLYLDHTYLVDSSGNLVYEIDTGVAGNNNCRFNYLDQPAMQRLVNVPFTNEAIHFSITPIDSNDAILSITSYGPGGGTASVEMPYSTVGGVYFEAGWEHRAYMNNMSITPEPGAAMLYGAMGLLLRRSRKSRSFIV